MRIVTNQLSGIALSLLLVGAASAQTNVTAKARSAPSQPVSSAVESDRTRDGLVGPVRRVRTEVAKLSSVAGNPQEGKHTLLEVVAYDIRGNKIQNQYFPIAGAILTGKEVYKYDEKGNISEMTLVDADGSLIGKEIYKYEFDFAGNWNKMTTSVAVVDGGRITFEPSEVTYRFIMYYLDENMLKSVQPANTVANGATTNVAEEPDNSAANKPLSEPRKENSAQTLPAATTNTDKVDSVAPVELKTVDVSSNQDAPLVTLDSEPPPSPGPKPILKPVSGGVLNGTALSLPSPLYPEAAKRMRASGTVSVEVVLDETGKVVSATATSGPVMLRESAIQAAMRARFSPTKLSGQPVKVSGVINYKFSLAP